MLVHLLKGHQDWTTLSRVKGGVKYLTNPETPCRLLEKMGTRLREFVPAARVVQDAGPRNLWSTLIVHRLQHHLERRPQRLHHKLDHQLIKSGPRLEGVMGAPDYAPDYDSEDYDEADYARAAESIIPSDDELENKTQGGDSIEKTFWL